MSTPTPRTDRQAVVLLGKTWIASYDEMHKHARTLEAELATERGKLDWVFKNCKVEANDYTTGNRDVYYVHDREDLGAAMKEETK